MLAEKGAGAGAPARDWLRALERTARLDTAPHRTLPAAIDELALICPDAPALLSRSERRSFGELSDRARRYGAWAASEGLRKGDVVALAMPNRPEYLAAWLGLSQVGVVVALINPSLRGASLGHAMTVAAPKRVIVDASLAAEVAAVAGDLGPADGLWSYGAAGGPWPRLDQALAKAAPLTPSAAASYGVTLQDQALLIYTSGSTGLPKAANVSHHRVMSWSAWFSGLLDITPEDRLYDCLPLCHSAGGVAAVGAVLLAGGSAVIAEKFSSSRFWDDIADWRCTIFQYIGDLCRYLAAAPPHPRERDHALRVCCGNGLGGEVWETFQGRFAIPRILEFYAATEGNFSLFNVEGRPGAIGRTPAFMGHRAPTLVRFDAESGAPARTPEGRCIRCPRGEAGEAIGRVSSQGVARFEGYTDPAASEAKLLRDVFEPGDLWVRSGDLMRQDVRGYFYFVDRVGDTFRWKGENVSTAEVAAALRGCPGVLDAYVYGVAAPGASGKAGMAALETGADFDTAAVREQLSRVLPAYARPIFLRIRPALERTDTFKLKKGELAAEGWAPEQTADPIFVDDRSAGAYVRLTPELARLIRAGAFRL